MSAVVVTYRPGRRLVVRLRSVIYREQVGGAGVVLTREAGETLGGHRVVASNVDGKAIYADVDNVDHSAAVLGITQGAAAVGAMVSIQRSGEMVEPSWSWTVQQPIFLGAGAVLTQTPPASGFCIQLGFAAAPTRIVVDVQQAIILEV